MAISHPLRERSLATMTDLVFQRYGGSSQVRLETFAELRAAIALHETWWAVLSCPTTGLRCDADFLALLDTNGDGRIHLDDLRTAVAWLDEHLVDPECCVEPISELPLTAIADHDGLPTAADRVLANLQIADCEHLSLDHIRHDAAVLAAGASNGDGIVPPDAIADDTLRASASDILKAVIGEADRCGRPGISLPVLDRFRHHRDTVLAWHDEGDAIAGWESARIERADRLLALDHSVRAWFRLCDLAQVDEDRARRIATPPHAPTDARDREGLERMLEQLPPAAPDPQGRLRWDQLHPGPLSQRLRAEQGTVGDDDGFDEADWDDALAWARQLTVWRDRGQSLDATALDRERLWSLSGEVIDELAELCRADLATAHDIDALRDLKRLLLFHRHLFRFANNFLSLPELYDQKTNALFEHGTLFLAGRACSFAMQVQDRATHRAMAVASGIHLLYIAVGPAENRREYVVPVTAGSAAEMTTGRRGVFRDVDGALHEAVVIDCIEQPVSLLEALLQPFARIGRFVGERLERWQAKADQDFHQQAATVGTGAQTSGAPPPSPQPVGGGLAMPVLGGSIAFAAVGSSFAFVTRQLAAMSAPTVLFALFVLCLVIMVPTGLIAAIKLYRRNLAGLLQAGGWAVNDRMRLTAPLGRLFTRSPGLPAGARSALQDEVLRALRIVDRRGLQLDRMARSAMILSSSALGLAIIACAIVGFLSTIAAVLLAIAIILQIAALACSLPVSRQRSQAAGWCLALCPPILALVGWAAWRLWG